MIRLEAILQDDSARVDLNVNQSEPPKITREIVDVNSFFSRRVDRTQTFALPFTNTNNDFFGHYYNANADTSYFDPTLKTNVVIYDDGIPVLEGYLQLNEVDVKNQVYNVTIYSTVASLVKDLGTQTLADLFAGYTALAHTYTLSNVVASWDKLLPLIGGGTTDEIIYPSIDWTGVYRHGTNGISYQVGALTLGAFRPAIKLKTILDRMFAMYGYTYDSDFLTSTYFENIYMTFGTRKEGLRIPPDPAGFQSRSSSATLSLTSSQAIPFNQTNYNYGTNYDTSTYDFEAPITGWHTFNAAFYYEITSGPAQKLQIQIDTGSGFALASTSSSSVAYVNTNQFDILNYTDPQTRNYTFSAYLRAGDKIRLYFQLVGVSATLELYQGTGYQTNWTLLTQPLNTAGGTVDLSLNLPDDIKAVDWLRSVLQKFNLYVESNPNNEKELFIEPFKEFYSAGAQEDWTDKLDKSQPIIVKPMSDYRKKKITFTDAEDTNNLIQLYKEESGRIYGDEIILSNDEFAEGEEKIESIFAPMPITKVELSSGMYTGQNYQLKDGVKTTYDAKPTLIYYDTKETLVNYADRYYTYDYQTNTYTLRDTWAPASHLSDAPTQTTTECLTFSQISYFTAEIMLNSIYKNTVYYKYWKPYIDEIYSDESRFMTAYFNLNAIDIGNKRLNANIFIKDSYWRINKIENYSVSSNKPTKVELVKILNLLDFSCSVYPNPAGLGEDGSTTWLNSETGLAASPTQECCEAAGFFWVAGTSSCWWKLGGSMGGATAGGDLLGGGDPNSGGGLGFIDGNNLSGGGRVIGGGTGNTDDGIGSDVVFIGNDNDSDGGVGVVFIGDGNTGGGGDGIFIVGDNNDGGGGDSIVILGDDNSGGGFNDVILAGGGQTGSDDGYIGSGQNNAEFSSGSFCMYFPGVRDTSGTTFTILYYTGATLVNILPDYNYSLVVEVNLVDCDNTLLYFERSKVFLTNLGGTITEVNRTIDYQVDNTLGGTTAVNINYGTNTIQLQITGQGAYDCLANASICGNYYSNDEGGC